MSNGEIDGNPKRSSGETIDIGARRLGEMISDAETSSRDIDPQSGGGGFRTSGSADEFRSSNNVDLPRIAGSDSVCIGTQSAGNTVVIGWPNEGPREDVRKVRVELEG